MIFRKIVVTAAIACLVLAFTACGDDDSSSFVEPEKESSDSGATLSGDSHEGSSPSSCSSKDDKSSSSVSSSSTNSSSSAKSSSSTDAKSSSSSGLFPESCEEKDEDRILTIFDTGERYVCKSGQYVKIESSSSGKVKKTCSADEEGTSRREDGVRFICKDGYWVVVESSSSVSSSSSYFDMTNQFNEKVSYGEFTDSRDGQKYRTIELKNGVFMESYTVFAENLNYGKMVSGGSVQGDSAKYCYDDDPWYCENGFGGLYTWSSAMGFPAVCDSVSVASEKCPNKFNLESDNEEFNGKYYFVQHQGICPEGWHIMNENEWVEISEKSSRDVAYYMGSKVAGFGNENIYGMSILPAGYWIDYGNEHNKFYEIKIQSDFWMPQQADTDLNAYMTSVSRKNFSRNFPVSKKYGNSVRCVKNY